VRVPLYGIPCEWKMLNAVRGLGCCMTAYNLNRYSVYISRPSLRGIIQFVPSDTGGSRPDWDTSCVEGRSDYDGRWRVSQSCRDYEVVLNFFLGNMSIEDQVMGLACRLTAAYLCCMDEALSRCFIGSYGDEYDRRCQFNLEAEHGTFLDWRVWDQTMRGTRSILNGMGILLPTMSSMYGEDGTNGRVVELPAGMQVSYQPADAVRASPEAVRAARLRCSRMLAKAKTVEQLRSPGSAYGLFHHRTFTLPEADGRPGKYYEITRKGALRRFVYWKHGLTRS